MLFRSLKIVDAGSPYNGKVLDLRVEDGLIVAMGPTLAAQAGEEEVLLGQANVAPGFVDIGAYLGDPGHEEREDVTSLRAAALAGGYVTVAALPNTDPVRQSVADVAYLLRQNGVHPTDLYPLVALSKDLAGKDMVDMLELHDAGALIFTDGAKRRVSGSLLKRTLEYSRVRDLVVMVSPYDETLVPDGQIHEGPVSTGLGLRGIPTMSEAIPLKEALELVAYTDGRLIVHLLSTAESVAEIRKAKEAGLKVWATVSSQHLQFTVEELAFFDSNFKMLPPLRETSDRAALIEGIKDGTIDCIVSNHIARHGEEKELEFPYADFGAIGLQTAFRQALAVLSKDLPLEDVITRFTAAPRQLLGQPAVHLQPGAPACMTMFTTEGTSTFTKDDLRGKTVNSPLLGKKLPGKVLGVYNHAVFTDLS